MSEAVRDLVLLLGLPLLLGVAILRSIGLSWRSDPVAFAGYSLMVGTAGTALVLFAWLLAGLPPATPLLGPVLLLVGTLLLLLPRHRAPVTPSPAPAGRSGEVLCYRVLLLIALSVTIQRILVGDLVPVLAGDDEAFVWTIKAKAIYHCGGFTPAYTAMAAAGHHPDYPLLNPLAQVWAFCNGGAILQVANRLPVQSFALAQVLILAGALRRLVRPGLAGLLLLLFTGMVTTGRLARVANADHMVALGLMGTVDAWLRWRCDGELSWWRLAAICLGIMVWSKNEGVLYLVALAAGAATLGMPGRRWRLDPGRAAWLLLPLVLVAATWLFNWSRGFGNDLVKGNLGETSLAASMWGHLVANLSTVLAHYGRRVFFHPGYCQLLPLVLVLLVLAWPGRLLGRRAGWLTVTILAGLVGQVLVYCVTPHQPLVHLVNSLDRVSYQLVPTMLVWLALVAALLYPRLAVGAAGGRSARTGPGSGTVSRRQPVREQPDLPARRRLGGRSG